MVSGVCLVSGSQTNHDQVMEDQEGYVYDVTEVEKKRRRNEDGEHVVVNNATHAKRTIMPTVTIPLAEPFLSAGPGKQPYKEP